jgi:lipopolysaccharide biosynthesis glycosyltransferase
MIDIIVGFDQLEAVAYHTFCQSVIDRTSEITRFTPLLLNSIENYSEKHNDGSNQFIYSRFLSPYIMNFNGWVIFADGDMVCQSDIQKLWSLRDNTKAVLVCKHNYETKFSTKYLGNKNENYPRKNWSSLILWNCEHPKNKILTPEFVKNAKGSYLHRFCWLDDHDIGDIPLEWNWLAIEYPNNPDAKIIHYTLGTPCFHKYEKTDMSEYWHSARARSQDGMEMTQ